MQRFLFVLTVTGFIGSAFGFPPGASDPCLNSPCGRGAICQTMTSIAVCTCPGDSIGDPFVDCNVVVVQTTPSREHISTSIPSTTHFIPDLKKSSSSGLQFLGTTSFTTPPLSSSNSFTHDFQIHTDDSRMPIRGSPSKVAFDLPLPPVSQIDSSNIASSSSGSLRVQGKISDSIETKANHYLKLPIISQSRRPYPQESINLGLGIDTPDLKLNSFIKDPMGQYSNCRTVNNIIVCADNSVDDIFPGFTNHQHNSDNHFREYVTPQDQHKFSGAQNTHFYPHSQQDTNNRKPTAPNQQDGQLESQRGNVNLQERNNDNLCKAMCGINSVCRLFLDRPVCGCPEGHTGDPSVKCEAIEEESKSKSGCERHIDCSSVEICLESKCVDPCNKAALVSTPPATTFNNYRVDQGMCGRNSKCLVIDHTPLCGCMDGFYGNPYVACVA